MPSDRYLQLRKEGVPDLHNNDLLKACLDDDELLSDLLEENKKFVIRVISQYRGNISRLTSTFNVTEEEILQQAYIGVVAALRKFDFDMGYKFTTFAHRPILWEVNQFLYGDAQLVRLNKPAINLLKESNNLEDVDWSMTIGELAEKIGVEETVVEEVLRFATPLLSLDPDPMSLQKGDDGIEDAVMDKIYVENLLNSCELDELEAEIVNLIAEGYNKSQIAKELGVYPMAVNRSLRKIRRKVEGEFKDKFVSKYEDEIKLIAEEMEELSCLLDIKVLRDLLDVCGYDISDYTDRMLYYIRQKAARIVSEDLEAC